jgi:hypothetical protein
MSPVSAVFTVKKPFRYKMHHFAVDFEVSVKVYFAPLLSSRLSTY